MIALWPSPATARVRTARQDLDEGDDDTSSMRVNPRWVFMEMLFQFSSCPVLEPIKIKTIWRGDDSRLPQCINSLLHGGHRPIITPSFDL